MRIFYRELCKLIFKKKMRLLIFFVFPFLKTHFEL